MFLTKGLCSLIASVERTMRRFIHRENIKHFQSLLETEKDEIKRGIILRLLAEEEAKVSAAEHPPYPQARAL